MRCICTTWHPTSVQTSKSDEFKAYVNFISPHAYSASTYYYAFLKMVDTMAQIAARKVHGKLTHQAFQH